MRLIRDERGQALMFAALCLFLVMGILALAIDVGYLRYQQQQLQTAADTAAMAGALEISTCGSSSNCSAMQTAAKSAVTENGFPTPTLVTQCGSSSAAGLILQVNNGPCALGSRDPNSGNAQYVEAVATNTSNTIFGAILGVRTVKLLARSEATPSGPGGCSNCCLYTDGLAFNASGNINMTCGIFDNGNLQTNNNDTVTTPTFSVAGSWSPNNCNGSCTFSDASPQTGIAHQADPLASLTAPPQPSTSSTNNQTPTSGTTLQPGYYPNGFNLNSSVSVTMSPGLYYMGGSINVNSGATLTGSGVELFFANGSLQPNSGSTVQLTAPTTTSSSIGTTAGMLVWEPSSNSTGMNMDAGSSSYIQGVLYLPNATLTLNSGTGVTVNSGAAYTAVDVNNLIINSSETFDIGNNYSSLPGGTSPLKIGAAASSALVE